MTVDLSVLLGVRSFWLTKKDQTGKPQRESLSTLCPTFSDPVKLSPVYVEKCWLFLQEGGNRSFFPQLVTPGRRDLNRFWGKALQLSGSSNGTESLEQELVPAQRLRQLCSWRAQEENKLQPRSAPRSEAAERVLPSCTVTSAGRGALPGSCSPRHEPHWGFLIFLLCLPYTAWRIICSSFSALPIFMPIISLEPKHQYHQKLKVFATYFTSHLLILSWLTM